MRDISRQSIYQTIQGALPFAARLSFAATVILIPVRARIVLITRPVPQLSSDYTNFLLFAADVAMLATLAFWLISSIITRRELIMGPRYIWIPLVGIMLAGWISVASSYDPLLSVYHSIRLMALFWFYLYVVNEIRSVRWIVIPVGLQILIQSFVALAQFIAQRSVGLQTLGEQYLNPAVSGVSVVVANEVRLLRVYGLSDHPNILGGCLAFGLLIILGTYLHLRRSLPILTAFVPAFPALVVTFSRSAWLAFVGGLVFIVVVNLIARQQALIRPLAWLALICLLLLAPLLIVYKGFFGVRLDANNSFSAPSVEQQSIGERILLINSALPIFLDHPFFGVGLGASPSALKAYYPDFSATYEPPHFAIFDAALETGLLGAVSYLAIIFSPFIFLFRHRDSLLSSPLTSTTAAVMLSLTIVGLFDYYTWLLVPGRLWQWLAWGLWAAALQVLAQQKSQLSQTRSLTAA